MDDPLDRYDRLSIMLSARMAELGLAQGEAADMLGVSSSTLGRWQREEIAPQPDKFEAIGEFLKASRQFVAQVVANDERYRRSTRSDALYELERDGKTDHPVGVTYDLRADTEAHAAEIRLATAVDALGAGLRPLAERLGKIVAEGIEPGPPATIAVAALDQLLTRLGDFTDTVEDLRNEIVDAERS